MPMSASFEERLLPRLPDIVRHFGTPFQIYDQLGIRQTCLDLLEAFRNFPAFTNFYAVKALPNPSVLTTIKAQGFGFDCSSIPELMLARRIGTHPGHIMFTSNNTIKEEYEAAAAGSGCILNLDDISYVPNVPDPFPELICFRYNPGAERTGNAIIGQPVEAKYGVAKHQIVDAYRLAIIRGAKRFGLHTMICSNELNYKYMVETVRMLLDVVRRVSDELHIKFDFINMGGGLGIPYKPGDQPLNLSLMANEIEALFQVFKNARGYAPRLVMESGRMITGPHGVLVTTCINRKETYKKFRGVDACMSAFMRPGMYWPNGGYHYLSVLGSRGRSWETVNVVGSLCENNDQFAHDRELPVMSEGDIVLIHDTGAHAMGGFPYNGRLKPQELMLMSNGNVHLIRRAETVDDLFATLKYEPKFLSLS